MELYQIRYFLAVSRTLNFTQAAEECNVTQPALTRAIKKLEDELGGDLMRRERNRSHLTELGKAIVPLLQQSYDAANAAKAEAETYGRGEIAPLRIGLSETVSSLLLEQILAELHRAVAGLNLTLIRRPASEIVELLQAGDIHFGILAAPDEKDDDRLRKWPLFDEDIVLCGSESTGKEIGLARLDGMAIIARPYCESDKTVQAQLEADGIVPEPRHVVSRDADLPVLVEIADAGVLLPRSSAAHLGLDWVGIEDSPLRRTVMLIEAAGRKHNDAAMRFLRQMRAANWRDASGSDSIARTPAA